MHYGVPRGCHSDGLLIGAHVNQLSEEMLRCGEGRGCWSSHPAGYGPTTSGFSDLGCAPYVPFPCLFHFLSMTQHLESGNMWRLCLRELGERFLAAPGQDFKVEGGAGVTWITGSNEEKPH